MLKFEGLPIVVRISSEGDLKLLQELVHAGEQRLRRAGLRRDTRRTIKNDDLTTSLKPLARN
jgi:hypothetical protein